MTNDNINNNLNTQYNSQYNTKTNSSENQQTFKSIDDVIASVNETPINKFNYTVTTKPKKKLKFISFLSVLSILSLLLVGLFIPGFVGKADYLPIITQPSNEKLLVTSKSNPFVVKHKGKYYYATKNNGIWEQDLSFIIGPSEIEIGTFTDLGFIKLNAIKMEKVEVNRSYSIKDVTLDISKYITSPQSEFRLKIASNEKYFKVTNNNKVIYETNSKSNQCNLKYDQVSTISCPYTEVKNAEVVNSKITITDEYSNTKTFDEIKSEIVDANDFYCDPNLLNIIGRIYCYGTKNGDISIDGEAPIKYTAYTRFYIPKNKTNKIVVTMKDIHDIEVIANLNLGAAVLPLKVNITTTDKVNINPTRTIQAITYKLTGNYTKSDKTMLIKDLSSNIKLRSYTATKNLITPIFQTQFQLPSNIVLDPKTSDTLTKMSLEINLTDELGAVETKTCAVNAVSNIKYAYSISCE